MKNILILVLLFVSIGVFGQKTITIGNAVAGITEGDITAIVGDSADAVRTDAQGYAHDTADAVRTDAQGYVSDSIAKYPGLASYVIEEISGTVYARPGVNTGLTAYADTNLTSVINSAMGQLTNGGLIQIRKGTYDHLDFITVPHDGITIEGEGPYSTILIAMAALDVGLSTETGLINITSYDSIYIKNLQIDGNVDNQTLVDAGSTTIARLSAIATNSGADHIVMDGLYIHSCPEYGIWIGACTANVISNCKIDGGWAPIQTGWYSYNCLINDNYLTGGSNGGIGVIGYNHILRDNYIIDNYGSIGTTGDASCGIVVEGQGDDRSENIIISGGYITGALTETGIGCTNSFNTVIDGVTIYNIQGNGSGGAGIGVLITSDSAAVVKNCLITNVRYAGISTYGSDYSYIMNNVINNVNGPPVPSGVLVGWDGATGSTNNKIMNNYIRATYGIYISSSGSSNINNIITNNIIGGSSSYPNGIRDEQGGNYIFNNYGETINTSFPDAINKNVAVTATSGGTGDGIIRPGSQNITVTSAGADSVCCLPAASSATIGTVITGTVGANGFELRVAASQATTVYLNGVTTNVEAAIPASTNFRVTQIDATHWILECTTELGAVLTAIVPNGV